jgi:prolyl-tRNA synthetase
LRLVTVPTTRGVRFPQPMPRLSEYLLATERKPPADAEALSHKLMVRAGLVRQVGAGLWSWLPAGWRSHQRVVQIVREEMDGIGALETLMPIMQPAELWKRSGRIGIDELFRLKDRRDAEMVLAMTGEEVVTTHATTLIRSYRDLPLSLYHFQIKERDEPRPRAGVLRTREFVMKDSYSLDRDPAGLDASYEKHARAYDRIFDRCGIEWYSVKGDVGMMGGHGANEYMAPCAAGENDVVLAPGYAANIEVASADPVPVELPAHLDAPEEVSTPGLTTVEEVARALSAPAGALLKSFPVILADGSLVLVVVRGDHRVNEIKLALALGSDSRPARPDEFESQIGPAGFMGPVGAAVRVVLDEAVRTDVGGYIVGANRPDFHLRGVQPGRDFSFEVGDVREVVLGDTINGTPVRIEPAIEIGNIFKLGTRFSDAFGATYLDHEGATQAIWMGSYGIGPARVVAAAIEQFADEQGISWPRAIAPFDVHLVTLGKAGSDELAVSERLYDELLGAGLETLYDDRDASPGEKFADAELLGVPLRVTVGRKALAAGELEVQLRRGQESSSVPLDGAVAAIADLWRGLP